MYTFTLSDPAGDPVVTLDSTTQTFSFEHLTDLNPLIDPLNEFMDYTVTVTGTSGLITPVSVTQTFNLRIWNPCHDPLLTPISLSPSPFVDETDILGAVQSAQSWDISTMFSYTSTIDCGSADIVFYLNDGSQTPLDPVLFADQRNPSSQILRN